MMRTLRTFLRPLPLLLLILSCPGVARADRESSQFFVQRADKALAARSWVEAEQHYRRALDEDATNLPARLGLAEALLGAGQREPGLEELRRFCADTEAAGTLPAGWPALVTKAKKRLAELDVAGNELDKLVNEHVEALLAFANRWKDKDPLMAVEALTEVLTLRPKNAKAPGMLEALGSERGVDWKRAWNGKDFEGWTRMGKPTWNIEDGILVARAAAGAYLGMTTVHLSGSFDLRMEMRMGAKSGRGLPMAALIGTLKDERVKLIIGLLGDELIVREYDGHESDYTSVHEVLPRNLTPPLDPTAWNRYELRYREDTVQALVNGRELITFKRAPGRDEGYMGVQVQNCDVEFRAVEYAQR